MSPTVSIASVKHFQYAAGLLKFITDKSVQNVRGPCITVLETTNVPQCKKTASIMLCKIAFFNTKSFTITQAHTLISVCEHRPAGIGKEDDCSYGAV